jgi:hypothetical protein
MLILTVASQVKQTLAGLKSAQSSFETFALQTQNEQAKQLYQSAAAQTQDDFKSWSKSNHSISNDCYGEGKRSLCERAASVTNGYGL